MIEIKIVCMYPKLLNSRKNKIKNNEIKAGGKRRS